MSPVSTRPEEITLSLPPWPARPSASAYSRWIGDSLQIARNRADWYINRPLAPRPFTIRPEESRTRERKLALYLRLLEAGFSNRSALAQAHLGDQTIRARMNSDKRFRNARRAARHAAHASIRCPYHGDPFEVSLRYETPRLTCPSCSDEGAEFQLRLRALWDDHFGTKTEPSGIRIMNAKPSSPTPEPARRFHRRAGGHR